MYMSIHIYIYIYIYRERERERDRVNSHLRGSDLLPATDRQAVSSSARPEALKPA